MMPATKNPEAQRKKSGSPMKTGNTTEKKTEGKKKKQKANAKNFRKPTRKRPEPRKMKS
jgi:hypothetical protein